MIVSKLDLRQILNGYVGETTVQDDPPAVGAVCWVRETPRVAPACRAQVVDLWPLASGGFAVLLERVQEGFALPERQTPTPALRLTRAQRAKLFAGECPHIGGEGRCPVEVGVTIRLSSRVALRVLRVDFKQARWTLHYELRDTRDTVRLLRRTPPAHRDDVEYVEPTPGALRDAAEQSAYTSVESAAVADAGEAPPKVWLDVRAKAISEFSHQRRLARHAEKLRDKSKQKTRRNRAA